MKKVLSITLVVSLCLFGLMGLVGCSSSDNGTTTPAVLIDITGTWHMASAGLAVVWTIVQDANGNLTGQAARTADVGTLTGTNISNAVTIHIVYSDATEDFTGLVNNNDQMSGTYNDSYGTVGEGWTAVRAQ